MSNPSANGRSARSSIPKTLRKCYAMLPAAMRWRWAMLAPAAFVRGLLEAGAAAAVFGLIKIISDPAQLNHLPVISTVVAIMPWRSARAQIVALSALLALYYMFKNLVALGIEYLSHKVIGESLVALKNTMLSGYLGMPYPFHARRNSADLIWNVNHAAEMVCDDAMSAAVSIASDILNTASIAIVLMVTAPKATLIASGFLAGVIYLLLRFTRGLAERYGRERHRLGREMAKNLQEAFGGIKEIKALGREAFFLSALEKKLRDVLDLGYVAKTMEASAPLFTEALFVGGALAVIALLTEGGAGRSEELPLLALFAYSAFRVVPSVNRFAWRANQIRGTARAADVLYEDYLLIAGAGRRAGGESDGDAAMLHDRIELDHVSYTYEGAAAPVLHDVSLTIRVGESIGIVGATGAGKSTLADLVVGLLQPSSGRLLIDGVELGDRSNAWRRHIGYVPQSIFLIDDTLRRNIAFGISDADIDDASVRAAVRMAQLGQLVAALPAGLDTCVGERGIRLSGGERQRIGIARALYHNPDLLVFDEATSALDQATEAQISGAIDGLRGSKTLLVVAHRLSTVRRCDRLVFIADGRIRASGPHDELMQNVAEFRQMATAGEARRAESG